MIDADDGLHPFPSDDPAWVETMWFGWVVPDRRLVGYVYVVVRPSLGRLGGGVLVYDDSAELPWELPWYSFPEPSALSSAADLRELRRDDGLAVTCLDGGTTYAIAYRADGLSLDLRFEAISAPLISRGGGGKTGHLDQFGHVVGLMVLEGENIAVDCVAMRDRGWGSRRYADGARYGYSYGATDVGRFLTVSSHRDGADRIVKGFVELGERRLDIVRGRRAVERDDQGRPVSVALEAVDSAGHQLRVEGRVAARQTFTPYPDLVTWNSLVRWEWHGADAWGEDQDAWHARTWRRARAARVW